MLSIRIIFDWYRVDGRLVEGRSRDHECHGALSQVKGCSCSRVLATDVSLFVARPVLRLSTYHHHPPRPTRLCCALRLSCALLRARTACRWLPATAAGVHGGQWTSRERCGRNRQAGVARAQDKGAEFEFGRGSGSVKVPWESGGPAPRTQFPLPFRSPSIAPSRSPPSRSSSDA